MDNALYLGEISAGLTGILNLDRALGRLADLALPRLGAFSAVHLDDSRGIRVAICALAARPRRPELENPGLPQPGRRTVADPQDLMALGADPRTLAGLFPTGPVHVATAVLHAFGQDVGTLTVARRDRAYSDEDLGLLAEVARRGAAALAAARAYEERSAVAATLRAALLPPPLPDIPGLDLGARYRAATEASEIGGDFYQVYPGPDGRWGFEIGDVCGKGIEAAVLTGQVRQSLRTAAQVEPDPARALDIVNRAMRAIDGTRFVTLVHGHLDVEPAGVTVTLSGGGHPRPMVLRTDGRVETVESGGMIVGMLRHARFSTTTLRLSPGDTLVLYTDGVTEAGGNEEQLGVERVMAMLRNCAGMRAQAITERLEQLVLEYLAGRPHDDLALLAIRAEEHRG